MDFAMFEKIANNSCSEEGVVARFYDRAVKTGEVGGKRVAEVQTGLFLRDQD